MASLLASRRTSGQLSGTYLCLLRGRLGGSVCLKLVRGHLLLSIADKFLGTIPLAIAVQYVLAGVDMQ